MARTITPSGTATGNGWQYQLERGGFASAWVDYPVSFANDPEDGEDLRVNVNYYLSGRNLTIPDQEELVAIVQVTEDGRVVTVDETGYVDDPAVGPNPGTGTPGTEVDLQAVTDNGALTSLDITAAGYYRPEIVPVEALQAVGVWTRELRNGTPFDRLEKMLPALFLKSLLQAVQGNAEIGQLLCDLVSLVGCGGSPAPSPTATIVAHYEIVGVPAQPVPEVVAALGRYDPDRGFLALANAINGDSFDVQLQGQNGTVWTDIASKNGVRFAGSTSDGSYLYTYGYLPDGNYREIWQPAGNTDPARVKTRDFTVLHTFQGSVDVNNCDGAEDQKYVTAGHAEDLLHPGRPVTVVLYKDGVEYARQTVQGQRVDVRDALRAAGIQTDATTFGYRFVKGDDARDGQPHTWEVRVLGSSTEFTYNANKTITCGTPPTPDPYIVDYEPVGSGVLFEGGNSEDYFLDAVYNTGTRQRITAPVISQVANVTGLSRTSIESNSGARLQLAASSIGANQNVVLDLILSDNTRRSKAIQLINADDTRPGGLTNYKVSYNFTRNGSTKLYSTLDDANLTACKHFAGTEAGNLNLFDMQAASLADGTTCYLGTGTNTAVLSNEIYYVCDSSGGNTVLRAIQIVGGKIQSSKVNPNSCQQAQPEILAADWQWIRNEPGNSDSNANRLVIFLKVSMNADFVSRREVLNREETYVAYGTTRLTDDPNGYTHRFEENGQTGDQVRYSMNPVAGTQFYAAILTPTFTIPDPSSPRVNFYTKP